MSPAFEPYDVAIAGAGISGLSCAWALRRRGLRVAVLEAGHDVGGCVTSIRRGGCIADGGPQSFASMPAFRDLVASLDLDRSLQLARCGASMYFYSRGHLTPAPSSPAAFLRSSLLSPIAKLRLLGEPLIGARFAEEDESVADFVARRAGRAVVDAIVRPLIGGIFAGDPAKLSARSALPGLVAAERRYTSVIVGAIAKKLERSSGAVGFSRPIADRRTPLSIIGGNDILVRTLASRLAPDVRLDSPVTELILRGANIELAYEGSQRGSVVARRAVLAVPADVAGRLLAQLEPEAATALAAIPYVPIAQIALSYPRSSVSARLDGFGFLAGEKSGLRLLGCAWNSSMFADRCPKDRVLVTAFLGGAMDADVLKLNDEELVRIAHSDLQPTLGIEGVAPAVIAGYRWDRAIPQYELGHADRLKIVAKSLSRLPQVVLAGNYLTGPSINDCIARATQVAAAI